MEIALSRGRMTGPIALIIASVLVFVATGYAIGLFQTLGYEKRSIKFSGFASSTSSGGGFGLKKMLFFEGQTVFIAYDAEIREGTLRLGILKTLSGSNSPHHVEVVSGDGSGETTYRIPETGMYSIYFTGSPTGNGYDLSYSVRWGAR
jgi:hypothetical protein